MNKEQIKSRIEELNRLIQENTDFTIFTLNEEVVQFTTEIDKLQALCGESGHDYINGTCKYCSIVKGEN